MSKEKENSKKTLDLPVYSWSSDDDDADPPPSHQPSTSAAASTTNFVTSTSLSQPSTSQPQPSTSTPISSSAPANGSGASNSTKPERDWFSMLCTPPSRGHIDPAARPSLAAEISRELFCQRADAILAIKKVQNRPQHRSGHPYSSALNRAKPNASQPSTSGSVSRVAPQPSTSRAPPPCTSRAPPPCTSRVPPPCSSRAPPPSTSRAPTPCTSRAPTPCTSRAPTPCTSRAPTPCTSRAPTPCTSRAPTPCTSRAPPPPPQCSPTAGIANDTGDKSAISLALTQFFSPVVPQVGGATDDSSMLLGDTVNEGQTSQANVSSSGNDQSRSARKIDGKDETSKELNQCLLSLLECPVCTEWIEPPMSQCRRGHLVCIRCRVRLASCPVCRATFSSVRNRAMEEVADLLRYPCRNGCAREARLRLRAAHEASCPLRLYSCPAPGCQQPAITRTALVAHTQATHTTMVKNGPEQRFSVQVNAEQHEHWFILALHGIFHLRIDVDISTQSINVYVAFIGPKNQSKQYKYEVSVIGKHDSRKLVYTRTTHSDLDSESTNVGRVDCFHISLDQALNFLRIKNQDTVISSVMDIIVVLSRNEDEDGEDSCDS